MVGRHERRFRAGKAGEVVALSKRLDTQDVLVDKKVKSATSLAPGAWRIFSPLPLDRAGAGLNPVSTRLSFRFWAW